MKNEKRILVVSFQSLTKSSGAGMAKFGYYISEALHKRGLLENFIVHSKGKFQTNFPSAPVSFFSRYYLRLLQLLNGWFHFTPHRTRFFQEMVFDWFCRFRISKNTEVIVATQPFLFKTFRKAKKLGITTVFIPGTAEENFINRIVKEEQNRTGITEEDAYTYPPRLSYYNASMQFVDIVLAPFSVVYDAYKTSAYNGKVEALFGYLKPETKKEETAEKQTTFKVGYLAHTVLLKGLQYLLEAWGKLQQENLLSPDMELHIAGAINPEFQKFLDKKFAHLKQVFYAGHVHNVSKFYQSLSLFVIPSLTDGTPYTAIEAALFKVPVLLTENCGSKDFLNGVEQGCIVVPIRDAQALYNAILNGHSNRTALQSLGEKGFENVAAYDSRNYVNQLANYFQQLLSVNHIQH